MKRIITLVAFVVAALSLQARSPQIGSTPLKSYNIVYDASADPEMGSEAALRLQASIKEAFGIELPVLEDGAKSSAKKILIVGTPYEQGPFVYSGSIDKGNLVLSAGGCWAFDELASRMLAAIRDGRLSSKFSCKGSVEGEFLFPREEGVNLRILDDNIWLYDSATSQEEWKKAGVECTNGVRAPQFAQLVRAYMPDVIGFQEMSMPMRGFFNPLVEGWGYKEAFKVPEGTRDDTPVYYNENTVELLGSDYCLFTPSKWSNSNTKSFTWGAFRLKENGKTFILLSTHLWWKGDDVQKGSTFARAAQIRLVMAEVECLKEKYNCPVFVVGDMNCHESSLPIQQFISSGYVPCYKAATGFTSQTKGHHPCGPHIVGNRTNLEKPRAEAIDHCFLYNGGATKIRNFKVETSSFTILLTDHCPNIIDAVL